MVMSSSLTNSQDKSQLRENNLQVTVIDYNDPQSLTYALRGIDTVISTVTGPPQLALIQAAYACRVRRFAPAEFEGLPSLRPANHPLDRGRAVARQWLAHYAQEIQSTVFVCGILYERFQPGGLRAVGMANNTGSGNEGDYIMNCRSMVAHAPIVDANGQPNVTICMTAMNDVARFVTRALDLPQWPAELRMLSERVRVAELINTAQALRGTPQMPPPLALLTVRRPSFRPVAPAHHRDAPRSTATSDHATEQCANEATHSHRDRRGTLRLRAGEHEFDVRYSADTLSAMVCDEVGRGAVKRWCAFCDHIAFCDSISKPMRSCWSA